MHWHAVLQNDEFHVSFMVTINKLKRYKMGGGYSLRIPCESNCLPLVGEGTCFVMVVMR